LKNLFKERFVSIKASFGELSFFTLEINILFLEESPKSEKNHL
jgi:hypothetical protein